MNTSFPKLLVSAGLVLLGIGIGLLGAYLYQQLQDNGPEKESTLRESEAREKNFDAMTKWLENYKRENPAATDEDARDAFDRIWKG